MLDIVWESRAGIERAYVQQTRLEALGLTAAVKHHADGGLSRIGAVAHAPTWLAPEAFLGRPP
jgi:hypothetical protein